MYKTLTAIALTFSLLFSAGQSTSNLSSASAAELQDRTVQPNTEVVSADNKLSAKDHKEIVKSKRLEMTQSRGEEKRDIPASITKLSDAYLESIQKESNANLKGLNLKTPESSNYKTDKTPVPFKSSSLKDLNLPASLQLEGYEQSVSKSVDSKWKTPQTRSQNNQVIPQELNSQIFRSNKNLSIRQATALSAPSEFNRVSPSQINQVSDIPTFQSRLTPADLIERKPFQVSMVPAGNISVKESVGNDIVNAVELLDFDRSRNRTNGTVAILQSEYNSITVANMANALMVNNYEAVLVNPEDIDELEEALYYDVFVIGGSGYSPDISFSEVYEIINFCVNEYGRGVVHTGWGMYSAINGSDPYGFLTEMLPINLSSNHLYNSGAFTALDSINFDSPLMDSVSSFVCSYAEYSDAGIKDGAYVHAWYANEIPAVVSWEYGQGRVVNLGQVYMGNSGSYNTESLFIDDSPFNLLTNSIDWASDNATDENDELVDCACDAEYYSGDRVVSVVDNPSGLEGVYVGSSGTVVCGSVTTGEVPVLIAWDDAIGGHNGNDYCECGNGEVPDTTGWWVACFEIEMDTDDNDLELDNSYTLIGEDSMKVYIMSDDSVTWATAHEEIDQLIALYDYYDISAEVHMATLHSQEENDLVYQGVMDSSDVSLVFIGLTDEAEEGNWEWVTGEELTYTNWEGGEGEGGDSENFVALNIGRNGWQDHGEGVTFSYVVEITFNSEDDEEDNGEGFSIAFDDGTTASYDLHLDSLIEEGEYLFYNVHEATITLSDGTVIEASSECRDHGAGRVTWDGYMLTSVVYDSVCNDFAFDATDPTVDMIEFMSNGGDVDFLSAQYYGAWSGGTSATASLNLESDDGDGGDPVDCACEAEYFVGDRVVLTVDNPDGNENLFAGTRGTVFCGGETPFDLPLLIEWDVDSSGHQVTQYCDCGRDSTDNEGLQNNVWWVGCDQVELEEEDNDENYLSNGSFEDATMQENEWQYLPNDWEGYPHQNSQTVVFTGETIYNSEDTFEAFDGNGSLKIWGLYDGENTENNVFQTWYDGELEPGTRFNVEAALMSHNADFIGQGGNSVILFAKYFTSDWGWLGMDVSEPFDGSSDPDMWYWKGFTAEVPEGASTVQVGAMLIQPTGDDHGSVYLDSFWMWETDDDEEPGDFVHLGEFEGHHYFASPEPIYGSQYPDFVQEIQNNSDSGLVVYPVTISSEDENTFLSEQIMNLDSVLPMSDYWIGLTDQWSEGDWMWYNGEEVTYDNWAEGEPNGGESENYGMLWPESYQWNDGGDWELPFIVELEFEDFEGPRDIFVDGTNGNDFEGDGSFDYPYSTISKAVSESQSGGSVLVAPGSYSEDILVEGLTDFNIYSMEGPDYTTIQGNDNDTTALSIHYSGYVGIWGFTFSNSVGYKGGAIHVAGTDNVLLYDNRFFENHALWYGGGVASENSGIEMYNCHFSDNTSEGDGGGLFIIQEDSLSYAYSNVSNSFFENNIAADEGAGIYAVNTLEDYNMDLYLDQVVIYNNSASRNTGLRVNGPIYLGMYSVNFMNNVAENYAAGMGIGNGVQAWSDHCSFMNNTANESDGNNNSGGVSVWSNSYCSFYFNTFVNNSAAYGSHITAGGGGNVYIEGCIIWGYNGENGIAAVQWDEVGSYVYVSESDIWNGEASYYYDDYSQVDYDGVSNIELDPFFCGPDENWFAVDELSPAVTSGGEIMGAFGTGCSGTIPGEPMIVSVEDVPADQGGRVYVTFEKSLFDTDGLSRTEMYTVERLDGDDWVGLTSVGAYSSDVYVVEATTLSDSTSEGDALMTYRVIANMDEGNFDSDPSEGFSVDNIAPDMLTGLQADMSDGIVYLSWEGSEANDFSHYAIYYSTDAEFEPSGETMIGTHSSPSFEHDVTEIGDHYYIVSAFDVNENEGDHSESVNVTLLSLIDVHGLPETYALHQNYPNPFNPTTTLRYDLPEDSYVSIVIFDMMGRQVRTLKNGQASAGYHSMMWNATNDIGSQVSAGVYIYTIQAGDYRDVRKMILLK